MKVKALKIENVSKQYKLGQVGTGTLSDDLKRWWYKMRGKEDPFLQIGQENDREVSGGDYVMALRDINFELDQGEVVGIIGRNGAGKSTLLKLLSQVTTPTTGSIKVKGRIAALLEVGTGFHPELTGRENIFLNGAILGMTKKEIASKLDEIVAFSGVAKYLDTPVKRYSSGMKVRLGFAVAAHLEPEILVVDEVLAVGDAEFQKKSIGKMQDVAGQGRTVIFVSHNMSSIRNLCQKVIVLDKGKVVFNGDVDSGIDYYLKSNSGEENYGVQNPVEFDVDKNKKAHLLELSLTNSENNYSLSFEKGQEIKVNTKFVINEKLPQGFVNIVLLDSIGNKLFFSTDHDSRPNQIDNIGQYKYTTILPTKDLLPGEYYLNIGINDYELGRVDKYDNIFKFEIIDTTSYRGMKNLYRKGTLLGPELKWEINE